MPAKILPYLLFTTLLPAAQRYCNPLPIPSYPVDVNVRGKGYDMRTTADPTVIRAKGKYYLYPSNGMAWVSDDLVNWTHHSMELPGQKGTFWAPTVAEFRGKFYLTGNDAGLYRSDGPLGPWKLLGEFKDGQGKTFKPFDPMIFADDDNRVYFYYAGGGAKGIYGVELDAADLTRFKGAPVHFFSYQSSHKWEHYGDFNEVASESWIEGPWMTKRNGRYYLQYSGPGTEWKKYAVGVYTGNRPLGPFQYDSNSPILHDRGGLINGTAHHSVVEGPNGNPWAVYTILYRNRDRFERRLAMDPVGFDAQGHMFVAGPTETPQWAPGVKPRPWVDNSSGSVPLTVNKFTFSASSSAPGRDPEYAIDNNVRTWWEAAPDDRKPWLEVDLIGEFMADSMRLLFSDAHLDSSKGIVPGPYQYKLEVSLDSKTWRTALDKTANQVDQNIEFDEIPPVRARYVRLTITGAPDRLPIGLLEFTVFGKTAHQ